MRGKTISGQPNIKGKSQLPNPPIEMGITIKKIILIKVILEIIQISQDC